MYSNSVPLHSIVSYITWGIKVVYRSVLKPWFIFTSTSQAQWDLMFSFCINANSKYLYFFQEMFLSFVGAWPVCICLIFFLPEMSKPSASVEKETRRALSPPTPVPPQPSKAQSLPSPVPPKPLVPPAAAKPPTQPTPDHRPLPTPTLAPVPHKSPSCTSPSLSKPATFSPSSKAPQPQSTTVPSTPFSSRTALEKSASRAAGLPGQTPSSPRGLPPAALPQDEPPWMAMAKKKAKAWSEMPQIVQWRSRFN